MRNSALVFFSGIIILSSCFMGKRMIKLGDCPLSITVMAEEKDFDGFADVYLNERFIGTTDNRTGVLKVNLEKGEYIIWVKAEGYDKWEGKILLLGKGQKQNVLARLKKSANTD